MANNDPGQLTHRVAWEFRKKVSDGFGNETGKFAEVFQCRAGFTPLRGTEAVMASRLAGRQPVVVRIRVSSDSRQIAPDWRMRDVRTGQFYAVRSIAPTPDRMWFDVMVESGVAQ